MKKLKLDGHADWIREQLIADAPRNSIMAALKVNSTTFYRFCKLHKLDSFFNQGGKGRRHIGKHALEDYLVDRGPATSGTALKAKLIQANIKQNICEECGITQWNSKPITLELDHVNGNHYDNRLENLRILCPNCHSQTPAFRFKGGMVYSPQLDLVKRRIKKNPKLKQVGMCHCGGSMTWGAPQCIKCTRKSKEVISWPQPEEMKILIWSMPTTKVAKILGVSDKAVEHFCKKHQISKPPRGHWAKIGAGEQN